MTRNELKEEVIPKMIRDSEFSIYDIDKISDEFNKDEVIQQVLKGYIKKYIKSKEKYIGKCYKYSFVGEFDEVEDVYLKVISPVGISYNTVSCMIFYKNVHYGFKPLSIFYEGKFDFDSIAICVLECDDLLDSSTFTPITLDEYNKALDSYIEKLKTCEFKVAAIDELKNE